MQTRQSTTKPTTKAADNEANHKKWTLNKKASSRRIETTIGGIFMSGKKGMGQYSDETKANIRSEYKAGVGVRELSRKYEISRYAIQSWCGLRPEVELRHAAPLPKGRSKAKLDTQEQVIKRLKMENELLRNFLSAVGRK